MNGRTGFVAPFVAPHYETGVVVVDAGQVIPAFLREIHYVTVDKHEGNTRTFDFVADAAVHGVGIGDTFERREKYAVDLLCDVVVATPFDKVLAYIGVACRGPIPQAVEIAFAG